MHENHSTHLPKLHNQRVPTPVNQPGFFYSTVCMQTCTYMYTCVLYTNIRACENMNKIKKFFGKTKATKLHDWTQLNTQYVLFFLPHKETFIWDFWLLWNFIRPRGEGAGPVSPWAESPFMEHPFFYPSCATKANSSRTLSHNCDEMTEKKKEGLSFSSITITKWPLH